MEIKTENLQKPATKKQLWALFAASKANGQKHDFRADNLTMQQANELLKKFNSNKPTAMPPKQSKDAKLEKEFIDFMTDKMQGIINTAKEAIKYQSILEDDPTIFTDPKKRKTYAFIGFGCGISVINYDKRSKIGAKILDLSRKHRNTTFLKQFLKAFTQKEINYFQRIGCPLQALYNQDIRIGASYQHYVASFMEKQGVKNVFVRTFDD